MAEIRRVFAYHGAEHMTVHAYENDQPLTIEAIRHFNNNDFALLRMLFKAQFNHINLLPAIIPFLLTTFLALPKLNLPVYLQLIARHFYLQSHHDVLIHRLHG